MTFDESGLPRHPVIEKAFSELSRLDPDNKYTERGLLIAGLIAKTGAHKDPEAIAAGLLVPLAEDLGAFLPAKADLPGRVPEILEGLFSFGKLSMTGAPTDDAYAALDPAVRSVVLASSTRMFDVTAEDMAETFRTAGTKPDPEQLKSMLLPVKAFAEMVSRVEKDEPALVKSYLDAMKRLETCLDDVGITLAPAAKGPAATPPKP